MGKNVNDRSLPNKKIVKGSQPAKTNSVFSKPGAVIALVIAALILITGGVYLYSKSTGKENVAEKSKQVTDVSIMTDKGEIVVELRPDLMPKTVDNFMKLVNKNFYNGLNFHRVEDWVIQGGDPQGNGLGGPGWSIKLETNPNLKNVKYAIAMARGSDPDSAGSQFYILKKDATWLDGQYAVFGNVIKGQEVVDKIAIGDKMTTVKEVK